MNDSNRSRGHGRHEAHPRGDNLPPDLPPKEDHRDEAEPRDQAAPRGQHADAATTTPTTEGPPEPRADLTQLETELADARGRMQTYLDLAQRTQADFVNYKRRVEQERSDFARASRAEAILKVLPTLDDLTRAVGHLPPDLEGSDWAQGIVLIERNLRKTLEDLGVRQLNVLGKPFDPWQEEGLMHAPSAEYPPETVAGVIRDGYSLDGKVIRPAQVIISSGPPESAG